MTTRIINAEHEIYPGVSYAALAAEVANIILKRRDMPPEGYKVAGPFALQGIYENCPFLQLAMDQSAPTTVGLHHQTAILMAAQAVIDSLSPLQMRQLSEEVVRACSQ